MNGLAVAPVGVRSSMIDSSDCDGVLMNGLEDVGILWDRCGGLVGFGGFSKM